MSRFVWSSFFISHKYLFISELQFISNYLTSFSNLFSKKTYSYINNNPSAEGLRGESLGIDIVANLKMVGKLAVNKPIRGG